MGRLTSTSSRTTSQATFINKADLEGLHFCITEARIVEGEYGDQWVMTILVAPMDLDHPHGEFRVSLPVTDSRCTFFNSIPYPLHGCVLTKQFFEKKVGKRTETLSYWKISSRLVENQQPAYNGDPCPFCQTTNNTVFFDDWNEQKTKNIVIGRMLCVTGIDMGGLGSEDILIDYITPQGELEVARFKKTPSRVTTYEAMQADLPLHCVKFCMREFESDKGDVVRYLVPVDCEDATRCVCGEHQF